MTPLQFENLYKGEWSELESQVAIVLEGEKRSRDGTVRGERLASLYRQACEHLALARARGYPRYLLDRLERITSDAHQVIYQRREFGIAGLKRAVAVDFPRAVRANASYVWTSVALLAVPMLVVGWLVYQRSDLILSVTSAANAAQYEEMYSDDARAFGMTRTADTDWAMFGFYIAHNVHIAFQCFAGGLIFGLGSILALVFNGVAFGAVGGYLTERGLGHNFYPFVVTHGAFELTAIFLSGAMGLKLGHALLAPGRNTRVQSLVLAAREGSIIVYGFAVMLVIAAAIEAFWSSAPWIPPAVKFSVAAVCWIAVISYFTFQGRRAD